MATHDRQEKQDKDIYKENKDATDSLKEATSRDNNQHKERESSSGDKLNVILDTCQISNKEDNLEVTKKVNQLDLSNETVAAIKETTDDLEEPKATHSQIDNNRDPPVSSGEDLEDAPWIDDEPWEHTFYVGGSYPK